MSRLRAAYLLSPDAFELIYGPEQRAAVRGLLADEPPVLTAEEVEAGTSELFDVDVVLSGWGAPVMDRAFLERAPRLQTVLYGAGSVRGFVTKELIERGVAVSSAISGNAVPVADYTVSVVYLSLKRVWQLLRTTEPQEESAIVRTVPGAYDATVGLVGLGEVGRLVCRRLADADGLTLLAYDPFASPDTASDLGVELVSLEDLFAWSEVVSLHAPLHEGTRGMVTIEHLRSMTDGAALINTARGGIIRSGDLVLALQERPDVQAILDVVEPEPLPADAPLRALPNVVITPHIAGSLGRECRRMGAMMVAELERLASGRPLRWAVDLQRLDTAATP